MANDEGYYTGYYEYEYDYRIEYNDTANTVRIRAAHDSLRYMSAVTDSPMEVVAMETDRILFDAPSNPSYDSIGDSTRTPPPALRVTRTRLPEDLFLWTEPLDRDTGISTTPYRLSKQRRRIRILKPRRVSVAANRAHAP